MSSDTTMTAEDEGKTVVDENGETIGRVVEVDGGTAEINPDAGMTDAIMSKLGWGDSDQETYTLDSGAVDTVTDDEVRLGSM